VCDDDSVNIGDLKEIGTSIIYIKQYVDDNGNNVVSVSACIEYSKMDIISIYDGPTSF
jgi:restriction endonuclease S subunit